MDMQDLISGALGNCEVCNASSDEAMMIGEPGVRPFWVCPDCYIAYQSLMEEYERTARKMPMGRDLQKLILLQRDYLSATKWCGEGGELYEKGRYEEALQLFLKALRICRDQNKQRDYEAVLGNIATIYTDLGRFEEALKTHKEEETICRELRQDTDLGVCLYNEGRLCEKMGKRSEARDYAKNAVGILSKTGGDSATLEKARNLVARLT